MNIHRSFKFSVYHSAPVTRVKLRPNESAFFRVPNERAKSARVAFTIAPARPGRFITGLGMIVPDERPAVFRALIRSFAARDICEQQKRRTVKEQISSAHCGQFTRYGKYPRRPRSAIRGQRFAGANFTAGGRASFLPVDLGKPATRFW